MIKPRLDSWEKEFDGLLVDYVDFIIEGKPGSGKNYQSLKSFITALLSQMKQEAQKIGYRRGQQHANLKKLDRTSETTLDVLCRGRIREARREGRIEGIKSVELAVGPLMDGELALTDGREGENKLIKSGGYMIAKKDLETKKQQLIKEIK